MFIHYILILLTTLLNSTSYPQQNTKVSNIKIKCACDKNKETTLIKSNITNVTVLPRKSISNLNVLYSRKNIKWVKITVKNSNFQATFNKKSNNMPDISNRKLKKIL